MKSGQPPIAPTSSEWRISSEEAKPRAGQGPVRLDVRRLSQIVFYALILPGGSAIAFDFWLDLFPLLTFGAMVTIFPVAGYIILRSTLRELKNVIDQVAPEVPVAADPDIQTDGEFSPRLKPE